MNLAIALLIGVLFAGAVHLLLERSIVDIIFGLILLSHAANLLVIQSGGLTRKRPPLLEAVPASGDIVDPLPQALVLTAIVIGFGVVAFAIVLVARLFAETGTDDLLEKDDG